MRDLAVFTASTSRRAWALDWETAADRFVVEIDVENNDHRLVTVNWAIPAEGVSGSFEAIQSGLIEELSRHVGDLASELWPGHIPARWAGPR